jgi:hypothetical protein
MSATLLKYSFILLFLIIILAVLVCSPSNVEGFDDLEEIKYEDDERKKVKYGYYKIDEQFMRKIPYGYIVDPVNNTRIIPSTQTEKYKLYTGTINGEKYKEGEKLDDGYYITSKNEIAILPPNTMPAVKSVSFSASSPGSSIPVFNVTYDSGYINREEYYAKKFEYLNDASFGVPPTMYYTDFTKKKVSFLPEGKIANLTQGYGFVDDPVTRTGRRKNDYAGVDTRLNYLDISNNYDFNYHINETDMINSMKSGLDSTDLGGYNSMIVRDKYGNLVRLDADPRSSLLGIDGEIVYNKPGTSKYGMGNYVPDYVESQLLKNDLGLMSMSKYVDTKTQSLGFCELNKNSPITLDEKCNKLDGNICASTSCCVLFGGEKCVAGDVNGPKNKSHYTDLFVKNKDFYYHNSKCYGNCP